jgi:hypothetical protein
MAKDIQPVELTGSNAPLANVLLADGKIVPSTSIYAEVPMLYNGATLDFQRGNTQGILLASATRSITVISPDQTNHNNDGVIITLSITANPGGAETLLLQLQLTDPITGSGSYGTIASMTATAAVNQIYRLIIHPGASTAPETATNNKAYALPVPRTFKVAVGASGAGSWTYSVAYSLM